MLKNTSSKCYRNASVDTVCIIWIIYHRLVQEGSFFVQFVLKKKNNNSISMSEVFYYEEASHTVDLTVPTVDRT